MNNETHTETIDNIIENPIYVFDEINNLFNLFSILNMVELNPLEELD